MIYQKILLIKDSFNYSFIDLINEYMYFIFFNPIFNLVHEPQWLVYTILFIFNIISGVYFIIKIFTKKLHLKKLKFFLLYYLFFLLTFCSSQNVYVFIPFYKFRNCCFAIIYEKSKTMKIE